MTTTTALRSRQTSYIGILSDIDYFDGNPSKADLFRHLPTKTRAQRYTATDQLIRLGLVANLSISDGHHAYALTLTDAGRTELAHWRTQGW